MRKIINHKSYDTATAHRIGCWSSGYDCSDFTYCEEELYRKECGEYFLWGHGGAKTKYAVYKGGGCTGGSEVLAPLTYDEACEWAEEHMSGEDYEAEFGAVPEAEDDSVVVHVRISAEAARMLDQLHSEGGADKGTIVERALLAL